jgi:hypothetical protein
MQGTNWSRISSVCAVAVLIVAAGCHSKQAASTSNFKTAIGNYYNAHPECVWASPVKFPVEVDPNNSDQSTQYNALFDSGLLTRTTQQKREFIFGSKQVSVYDLSAKGRSLWSPEQTQPGYGNFCFGHRAVTSVDNFTTSSNGNGDQIANVDYHWDLTGVAGWANSTEMKTAFPTIQADESGSQVAQATLANTSDGWQVAQTH